MGRLQNNVPAAQEQQKALSVKSMAKDPAMVSRFSDVLGGQDKANQFLASVISAVGGNNNLQKCDPTKVLGCAMIAASLNLDVNPNLGFASIVPYARKWKDESGAWHEEQIPQFQMGWKGFVQLAMRTGKYRTMNVTEVYADEFEGYDPFKGELKYHIVPGGDRDNGKVENIVGYVFYFELVSGYSKMSYLSKEQARAHALRYSRAYQNDVKYKNASSPWSTMFDAMAEKTVVKNTLSKWGILSTQLITATQADQVSIKNASSGDFGEYDYVDNDPVKEEPGQIPQAKPEMQGPGPEEFEDSGSFDDGMDGVEF